MPTLDQKLKNWTLTSARPFLIDDWTGRECVLVVSKMTYAITELGQVQVASEPAPVRVRDEMTIEDADASIRFPHDLADEKPGTDVLLIGRAHPPRGESVTNALVELVVQARDRAIQKKVRVFGPRVWCSGPTGVHPGPAAKLGPTPLEYERAYGGSDRKADGTLVAESRNPVGNGIRVDPTTLDGTPAFVVEDFDEPKRPAGFGPIAAHWEPRRALAGTYDDQWRKERAPLRARDFQPRHNNVAPPDLWSPVPLEGDEPVVVKGMLPEGWLSFQLPRYRPVFRLDMNQRTTVLKTHLDTLLIDVDRRLVELVWRTRFAAPKKLATLDAIRVITSDPIPPRRLEGRATASSNARK